MGGYGGYAFLCTLVEGVLGFRRHHIEGSHLIAGHSWEREGDLRHACPLSLHSLFLLHSLPLQFNAPRESDQVFFTVGFYTNAADLSEPWSRIRGG